MNTEQDDHACVGPHDFCRACHGHATVQALTLFLGSDNQARELSTPHGCRACDSRGFFCKASPPCKGPHDPRTPMSGPEAYPPV